MPKKISPLDAYKQYFLDIKPYHSKILEVLQKYSFSDTINASFIDNPTFNLSLINSPLCNSAGFGVNLDACCGFDATECCDLFNCVGGFGIIFDNSDLTASQNILNINGPEGYITLSGNQTFDQRFQILNYISSSEFTVSGNQTSFFNKNQLFFIVPYNLYQINNILNNTIYIENNVSLQFNRQSDFIIINGGGNNGKYTVQSAIYDTFTNLTAVTISASGVQLNETSLGSVYIRQNSPTYNDGLYLGLSATFDGSNTLVVIDPSVKKLIPNNIYPGSVMIRSGYVQNRIVTLQNTGIGVDGDYQIQYSVYNVQTNTTTVYLTMPLANSVSYSSTLTYPNKYGIIAHSLSATAPVTPTVTPSNAVTPTPTVTPRPPPPPSANLYGYLTGPGFDGTSICNVPSDYNLNVFFAEKLFISVINLTVTPTPSLTQSASPTITPSPTLTPSLTQSISPTITPSLTPSPTLTPSLTQSASPTITPSPTLTPSLTQSVSPTPTPSITPSVSATDPYFSYVTSLMHFDGTNNSTTFTDQISTNTWLQQSSTNGSVISTTNFKFGTASLYGPNTSASGIYTTTSTAGSASGDFTVEGWMYLTTLAANPYPILTNLGSESGNRYSFQIDNNGHLIYNVYGVSTNYVIGTAVALSINSWSHVAVSRTGSTLYGFINGQMVGSVTLTGTLGNSGGLSYVGARLSGYLDDFRVTIGYGRYTANFTPPTSAFPNS